MDRRELLAAGEPVLLDGAMGTELARRGCEQGGVSNLSAPDAVAAIHREYADAGCLALTTNTLTMNRVFIESHGLDVDVIEVNGIGVELARSVAGTGLCVLGNVSSTGQMLEPYGTYAESQFFDAFREQAEVLAEAGADGFVVETMFDVREAVCAVRACRDAAHLPVIATMAFQTEANGGRTMMGDSAEDCALALAGAGADTVGANCGETGPVQTAGIVATMTAAVDVPIAVQPNAGLPRLVDGRTVFDMDAEQFARGIAECIRAGATIVGGCCGTTPAHIRALAERGLPDGP